MHPQCNGAYAEREREDQQACRCNADESRHIISLAFRQNCFEKADRSCAVFSRRATADIIPTMYIVSVTIFVKPECVDQFITATLDNATNTRREPGNLRFDVSQAEDDPTRFLLYEVYKAREDFAAHQQTAHYARWKSAVTDWMAQPRQGIKHRAIFHGDQKL